MVDHDNKTLHLEILKKSIDAVIALLHKEETQSSDTIGFIIYADTFLIYSKTEDSSGYPALVRAAKKLICTCIIKRLPVRGAISYGEVVFGHDERIVIGKAALEAYTYCEDQKWIGLILTPTASKQLRGIGREPVKNGFINQDVPLKTEQLQSDDVYAYRFIDGKSYNKCPLLPLLREMHHKAPEDKKDRYLETINFIEKYYTVCEIPQD